MRDRRTPAKASNFELFGREIDKNTRFMSHPATSRYLIVSNRLPVTASVKDGGVELHPSTGGLATAMAHVHARQGSLWIGWPGETSTFDKTTRAELDDKLAAARMVPVHLTTKQVEHFYEGFCNGVLWPLFHYLLDKVRLDAWRDWEAYREANERFADIVAKQYQPGDRIWIHDYHLMLLPAMLRQRLPHASIAFFLHIPFPASGVFRILPWRREILFGLLGADLVGFHTHAYQRHFLSSVLRLLGVESRLDAIPYEGRIVRIGAFPISIDTAHFMKASTKPEVKKATQKIRSENAGCKLLLGIDRLDYTKGLRRRVLAVERLLERSPELAGKFKFIQVAAPSRTGVEAYGQLRRSLDELVGRINARFSTISWAPLQYLHQTIGQDQLLPLYRAADVMVVTPTRDGMNLVAKEFVACRDEEDGVLVLSEFTGAAWELGEAIIVNPYDVDEIAQALATALTMPEDEQRFRMMRLRSRVRKWTVHEWAAAFERSFEQAVEQNRKMLETLALPASEITRMQEAEHLVLVLDYDGTLVPFASQPEFAAPDVALLELLKSLTARPGTEVHVASGRDRQTLERWFAGLDIALHAEHGLWERERGGSEWICKANLENQWKEKAREIMEDFAARTPGAFVEEKTAALCWHFRRCDPEFAEFQERELRLHLTDIFSNQPVEVMRGSKIVELRQQGVHKGLIITSLMAESPRDALIVAIGDDATDEDMFRHMPPSGIGIHVGVQTSCAPYHLPGHQSVRKLLQELSEAPVAELTT
jgi:trehalose 6-phosphate synthase/phosphatase